MIKTVSSLKFYFFIIIAPFFLNDLSNIFIRSFIPWLIIDYLLVKALPLLIIIYLFKKQTITFSDLGLVKLSSKPFLIWSVVMTAFGLILEVGGRKIFGTLIPGTNIGSIPWDPASVFATFDLYFGLFFVAFFEEVIFRGLSFSVLKRLGASTFFIFIFSSAIFGLIHWSLGVDDILKAGFVGGAFMICMWRTGSVWPAIVAHFIVNFCYFAGFTR